jgi:hypothetical protein
MAPAPEALRCERCGHTTRREGAHDKCDACGWLTHCCEGDIAPLLPDSGGAAASTTAPTSLAPATQRSSESDAERRS